MPRGHDTLNTTGACKFCRTLGGFYCLRVFDPSEITEWIEDTDGTALCPYCGIDSVISESAGYPLTRGFLEDMRRYWF